jgi:hypothetical protein
LSPQLSPAAELPARLYAAQACRAGRAVACPESIAQRWASVPLAYHGGPERSAGAPCWACGGLAGAERTALGEHAFCRTGKWWP